MIRNCIQCGKEIDREEMAFCPYCGGKLPEPKPVPEAPRHEKAEQWIRKAMRESSFPKRKEILEKGLKELPGRLKAEGRQLVNGFCFGPALVMDGELIDQSTNDDYKYNPKGLEPRSAIGQIGPLSYVLVLVEGRSGESTGTTFQGLANIMFDLGCQQAYNLDGGNSAELALMGPADAEGKLTVARHFEGGAGGRSQKDIIYFATAVPESEWQGE